MNNSRSSKKRKRRRNEQASEFGLAFQTYGVQPLGNSLFSGKPNVRNTGLGNLHRLTDELLCDIFALLPPKDLARSAPSSKAFYVFTQQDMLWRNLVLHELKGDFVFKTNWKQTYVASVSRTTSASSSLKIEDFYSDYLFQSCLCASVEMKDDWLSRDNIERRSNLSVARFVTEFERVNKPVLISDAISHWPALTKWTRDYLLSVAGDVTFSAGPVDMQLKNYFLYSDAVKEERPLYLFDPKFGEKVPQLAAEYEVPEYFNEDLFSILGDERPDYRWLIVGPARSGSSFHIDPNSTSAWNAVVRGSKKWIMYPPEAVPPGIHPSPDGAEVAGPVSITEWFMNFYQQTRHSKVKPVECICRAGEVVFVPRGWWHVVINLEDSVAITQNYVSRSNLLDVLEFLSRPNSQELVSGTSDRVNLYTKFKSRFEEKFPRIIEQLERDRRSAAAAPKKASLWESLTGSTFSFNFA